MANDAQHVSVLRVALGKPPVPVGVRQRPRVRSPVDRRRTRRELVGSTAAALAAAGLIGAQAAGGRTGAAGPTRTCSGGRSRSSAWS